MDKRVFKVTAPSTSKAVKKEEDAVDGPKIKAAPRPLKNMDFFFAGHLTKDKDELKKDIVRLGGTVSSKLHENIAAVISTEAEVKKMSRKVCNPC